jgi:glyoxylase-like metal-dependent hydrolase (beta-lactamase superfamily II)
LNPIRTKETSMSGRCRAIFICSSAIAIQVGEQGAPVVDTGSGKLADNVVAAIQKLIGGKPIHFVVNTSFHPDHIGGNLKIHAAGSDPSLAGSFFRPVR